MWKNYSNNSANISNSDIFCYLINGGPNVNLFLNMNKYLSNIMVAQYQLYHLLPVDYYLKSDQLDYELNMLHELTKSIVVKNIKISCLMIKFNYQRYTLMIKYGIIILNL